MGIKTNMGNKRFLCGDRNRVWGVLLKIINYQDLFVDKIWVLFETKLALVLRMFILRTRGVGCSGLGYLYMDRERLSKTNE